MHPNLSYLLVTATCFVSVCMAIRVDWNTNKGPIIPPTPRTTVRPVPPFREPAAVWEDLSNDIPNPNPYIYVPPPPSRPKQRLHTNINFNYNNNNHNYGRIVTPQNANAYYQQNYNNNDNNSPQVASLSPQYIPNVGIRYVAVVPPTTTDTLTKPPTTNNKYTQTSEANTLSSDAKTFYKMHGKYNVKTKKYKAYEKVKYVPVNYYFSFKPSTINTTEIEREVQIVEDLKGHELPAVNVKHPWSSHFIANNSTTLTNQMTSTTITTIMNPNKSSYPTKSYSKHVYAKDKPVKAKGKFNDSEAKAKNS